MDDEWSGGLALRLVELTARGVSGQRLYSGGIILWYMLSLLLM